MIEEIKILRYKDSKLREVKDKVVEESYLRIFVNKKEIIVLNILPQKIEYLVYGFLFTNNLIKKLEEIKSLKISENRCYVEIKNDFVDKFEKNCNCLYENFFNLSEYEKPLQDNFRISSKRIMSVMKKFQNMSKIFKTTGGVHSCGLSDGKDIIVFSEDISRHNAFDKIVGESLFKNLNFQEKIIFTSGRITSDIVVKTIKVKIPIVVSPSASTSYAVELGRSYNITLVGFARKEKFNIYSCGWRIL